MVAVYLAIATTVLGVFLAIIGFLIRWLVSDFNKKLNLLFDKIEKLATVSEVDKLEAKMQIEIDKKEAKFAILEHQIRQLEDRQNKCKSCNS